MIVREQDVDKIINEINKFDAIALDFETVSLTDLTPVAFSFAYGSNVWFCPIGMGYFKNLDKKIWVKLLQKISSHENLVFHHSAFDLQVLRGIGIELKVAPHDTLILSHLHQENGSHKLKDLVKKHFDYDMLKYKDVCGTGKKQISFSAVDDKQVAEKYASDDARYTLRLFHLLHKEIIGDKELAQAYNEVERPLLLVVDSMHKHGVPVSMPKIGKIGTKCDSFEDFYKSKLDHYMNGVNLNSSKQLKEYFIDKKKMPVLKKSRKTNEPSVDASVLEKYAQQGSQEAKWILDYRLHKKIGSTFVPALKPDDEGLIHPHFHQVGTTSGRFSSSNPNFQNIPKNKGFDVRACIEAPKGYTFVGADYSQMELRLVAHYSKDKNLIKAFNSGKDIHSETAKSVGCTRDEAKALNFGILYGMGINTLAKRMGTDRQTAYQHLHKYRQTYPDLQVFMNQTRQDAWDNGYVTMLYGRKRRLPDGVKDVEDNYYVGGVLRSISNAVIQGGCAMLMKKAMIDIHYKLPKDAHISAQIHDELIVMCKDADVDEVEKIVKEGMLNPTKNLLVPFKVDVKHGKNWKQIH